MEQKATFRYFYGEEADMHSFYRIPKLLFTNDYFKALSNDAKILYGLMLDRMSLSVKNQWFDEENKAYIYFSVEDIMELLNCGKNKAVKIMQELDDETGIGLIEKRRQGFGKVNIIYVKTFMPEKTEEKSLEDELKKFKKQTSEENEESTEVYNSNFMKSQNQTSRSPENKLQEVYISNPNNTNLSDTEMNDNKSNPIISVDEKRFDSDNRSGFRSRPAAPPSPRISSCRPRRRPRMWRTSRRCFRRSPRRPRRTAGIYTPSKRSGP